ncbi:Arc family DNA-binding protein [Candidatus Fukatsuia symbiotica]|uniref:Arc-like DNA binding domain-containing protein n=1 Tax=Candidatus Fukatsuia symbiotica TaxID=1878942 RepID=A0A2U8I4U4_9GAMM|nr:Arc family DNA-binding protein [Candidatus Fukatsuia symbiotica]AWK14173.1 hypothetical protein CCS41_06245 [Candidatus Fukatsuia symbiotica]MEA9446274.1 Arc family DNA-binding protein [Candidatus Fukatsuia symbiotica]
MIGTRATPQFNIRMPKEFMEAIKNIAAKHGRSMNSEITQILKDHISKNSKTPVATTAEVFNPSETA